MRLSHHILNTKEEQRHATLEDNYRFVYNQDDNNEQVVCLCATTELHFTAVYLLKIGHYSLDNNR